MKLHEEIIWKTGHEQMQENENEQAARNMGVDFLRKARFLFISSCAFTSSRLRA